MSYKNSATPLTKSELLSFAATLLARHHGRMQYRDGLKTDVRAFCVVNVLSLDHLFGHISGPRGNNATFDVHVTEGGPELAIVQEEQGYPLAEAYREIFTAIRVMMARAASPGTGPRSTKNWRGYYLRNSGTRGIGKLSRIRLQEAVDHGLITPAFRQSCLDIGFRMVRYG